MYTIEELAKAIGAQASGDLSLVVSRVSEPHEAQRGDLALAIKPEFVGDIPKGSAEAALLCEGTDWQELGLKAALFAPRPRFVLASVSQAFSTDYPRSGTIHPSAVIAPGAVIGAGATIGPFCHIAAGAVLGESALIESHVSIGAGAQIGASALIREGARICARACIGHSVIIQPGAVIGSDGFAFITPEAADVETARKTGEHAQSAEVQAWSRIYSLGSVEIGDNVEIGANTAIDRGTIRNTRIGHGVKIDNLAHIGHNVVIGDHSLVCGQVGIAGSTVIGRNCIFGGQVGINDNITIGDNVICGGATKVLSNIPSGRMMLGYPAVEMKRHVEMYKALRRLPRVLKQFAASEKSAKSGPEE